MIGRRIGHCDVLSRLGEGGMGQVFAGIDRSLDRPVAIKALRPELSRDPAFAARFRAEAGALARLSHPNVAHIYSLEQSGSQQFMILELVRGLTLQDLLARHGPLDEMGALALAAQAVAGLAAAHAQGIVHRDLKPANLMVTADGMLKLMDFGIARVGGAERLTRHGHMIGTLAFMAPEQIRGASGDARSDLYSLGLVLYEMLAGRSPFAAATDYEFLDAQVNQVPAPLRGFVPTLSDRFHDAIMRCLAKAPEHRFASAEAFGREAGTQTLAATAQEILRERIGAVVAPPVAPAPSTKLAPRPMQAAPPRAPTVLVPLGSATARPIRTVAPARARPSGGTPFLMLGVAVAVMGLAAGYLLTRPSPLPPRASASIIASSAAVPAKSPPTVEELIRLEAPELYRWHDSIGAAGAETGAPEVPWTAAPVAPPPAAPPAGVEMYSAPAPAVRQSVRRPGSRPTAGSAVPASAEAATPAVVGSGNDVGSGWLIRD